ncbi:hypothetical protein RvY_04651-1 [Ramazzottius varieornatus]|uniref:Receptor ligand binding region domain-containing protein n=1 Tax=Ramazzottius varieornatus TaxID=947166 RepID=A0A1D1USZ3_RAMVA|nr:hypothetical protein RvY_04651-1 [Ramazzottius varieornatus]
MGPACTASVEQIRGLLSSWNIPVLTTEAGGITGNQKAASKLLTRLGFNQEAVGLFLVKVLEYFSWTNIVIIFDSDAASTAFANSFEIVLRDLTGSSVDPGSRMLPISSGATATDYRGLLSRVRLTARVVVIAALSDIARDIMVTAGDMGMTSGDYVYITTDLFYTNGRTGSITFKATTDVGINIRPQNEASLQGNLSKEAADTNAVKKSLKQSWYGLPV